MTKKIDALINGVSAKTLKEFCAAKASTTGGDAEFIPVPDGGIKISSANRDIFRGGSHKRFESVEEVGYFKHLGMLVFLVTLHPGHELSERSCRRLQFDFACDLLKSADWTHQHTFTDWLSAKGVMVPKVSEGLFVFADSAGNFRFSYIQNSKPAADKGLRRFRRFTFYVTARDDRSNRTFVDRMKKPWSKTDALSEAFSVQALSDEFFEEYKRIYERFVVFCMDPSVKKQFTDRGFSDDKFIRDYVKKLMGRLVFLQFLEKKLWLGVPEGGKWGEGDANYLRHLFEAKKAQKAFKDNFLDKVLEPLFFDSLNAKRTDDVADAILSLDKTEKVRIPYLNGGLFEKEDIDSTNIPFPDEYFEDLFDTFDRFNFTIDENGPEDAEVGVDPEMLSRIFENLLEDNKDKGAFYTPKEIVDYMCKESLIVHLGETPAVRELVENYSSNDDLAEKFTDNEKAILLEKLSKAKICDPAIGSGAFPMGMLAILARLRLRLEGKEENSANIVALKKEIIQNNIYGVDIEAGAVDIARLRFWLSIVVDENEPIPLPNLDYKIMQGNSLLESYGGVDLSHVLDGGGTTVKPRGKNKRKKNTGWQMEFVFDAKTAVDEIVKAKTLLFDTTDHQKKKELMEIISKNVKAYISHKLPSDSPYATTIPDGPNPKFMLWHLYFSEVFKDGGFDIVIGNPPYINVELMSDEEKTYYKDNYSCFYKRSDIFCVFLELALSALSSDNGVVTYIIPSVVHTNLSYKKLRELILGNNWLREVCYTGGDVFNAPTVDTTILLCDKGGNDKIRLKHAVDFSNPRVTEVPADHFEQFQNVISVDSSENDGVFSRMFNSSFISVGDHFSVFQGIVTGNNPAFIFETDADAAAHGIEKALLHPLCHGRDIERYAVRSRERRIMYLSGDSDIKLYPNAKEWLKPFRSALSKRREALRGVIPWYSLQWPRVQKELDAKEKILIQNTRNESLPTRIVATMDDMGVYGTQGINFIIPASGKMSLQFLLGVLNSTLMNHLFKTKFLNLAIKAEYIKQLRIPREDKRVVALVSQILASKKSNSNADTSALELKIDDLVYDLYGLTDEERAIVDPERFGKKEGEKIGVAVAQAQVAGSVSQDGSDPDDDARD